MRTPNGARCPQAWETIVKQTNPKYVVPPMCHAASILARVAADSGLDAAGSPSQLSSPLSAKCNKARCIRSRTIHLEGELRISSAHAEPSRETRPPRPPNLSCNRSEHFLHAARRITQSHTTPQKISLSKIPNQHPSKLSNVKQTMDRPSSFEDPPYTHPPPIATPAPPIPKHAPLPPPQRRTAYHF